MSGVDTAYATASAADSAYSAELLRVFGLKRMGDARYGPEGVSTPRLRELSTAKRAADLALHEAFEAARRGDA